MAKDRAISEPFEQTARQTAEVGALLRMLAASEGTSSLSIGICNSPALRNYIIEKVKADKCAIELVKITEEVEDIFDFVRHTVTNDKPAGIFIVDMEKVLPSGRSDYKILRTLNATRELWRSHFHCPVIFWVPEYAATLLSIHARDFWSWLSHSFEFVSEQASAMKGIGDSYSGDIMLAGNLDIDQKHFRIAELEQRIKEAEEQEKAELTQYLLTWFNELAYIYFAIGLLDKAEQITRRSLNVHNKIGSLKGMANDYGNLGNVYRARGDLEKAEEMFRKSLAISEPGGMVELSARSYGNLGLIYRTKGTLDKAEEMVRKSVEISEATGMIELSARSYGNLGLIYKTKGDLDKAEKMHLKSLDIEKKLGRLEGIAREYGNLGLIYQTKGDLDKAEKMFCKSLAISEPAGMMMATANQYGNLGSLYEQRGEIGKARDYWAKALALYTKIGIPDKVKKVQTWIDES